MQKRILFAPRAMGAVHVCLLHRPAGYFVGSELVCMGEGRAGGGCGGSGSRESWLFLGEGVKFTIFVCVCGGGGELLGGSWGYCKNQDKNLLLLN